jgi:membrane-bound lytic murein transglycosylase A
LPATAPGSLSLVPSSFARLPGWPQDDLATSLTAFRASCPKLLARTDARDGFGTGVDWRPACMAAANVPPGDQAAARAFFESQLVPFSAMDGVTGNPSGLFTGYYQPLLHGSYHRGGRYTVPLYRRPADLVSVDLGQFRPALKGQRIAGRVAGGRLMPYATREQIEDGALAGHGLELVWVDSAIDAFFLSVQGSGLIQLDDGSIIGVAYDGDNGQAYRSIGRVLAAKGVPASEITLPFLKSWLASHPDQARQLMDQDPAFIFFRPVAGNARATGASGVGLTPGHSLAVDPAFVPYGVPAWIDAEDTAEPDGRFRHLAVAQDTGSAIKGPVRADIFFGIGAAAEAHAGQLKGRGMWWLLLPRGLANTLATRQGGPSQG